MAGAGIFVQEVYFSNLGSCSGWLSGGWSRSWPPPHCRDRESLDLVLPVAAHLWPDNTILFAHKQHYDSSGLVTINVNPRPLFHPNQGCG